MGKGRRGIGENRRQRGRDTVAQRAEDRESPSPDQESLPVAVRDDRAANSTRKIDSLGDIHTRRYRIHPFAPRLLALFLSLSHPRSLACASLRAPGTPVIFAALYTQQGHLGVYQRSVDVRKISHSIRHAISTVRRYDRPWCPRRHARASRGPSKLFISERRI